MKLLLDENLSHRLAARLQTAFPGTPHVRERGLSRAGDEVIWELALSEGFVIVSKDEDFHQRSFLHGAPPKFI